MRNYFNIVRSTGILFIGAGVFLLGATVPEIIERVNYYARNIWDNGVAVFAVIGLGFLIAGMAGLLKAKWFPRLGMTVLIFAFFGFSWLFFGEILDNSRGVELYLSLGFVVVIYVILFSFFLLLNNEYFLQALKEEEDRPDENDEILDA